MSADRQIVGLMVLFAACFAAAGLGASVTAPNIETWYASLAKPTWNPPNWIFGPVWTVLYTCMAVAAWMVWRRAGLAGAKLAMGLFAVQLVFNAAWSWLFFGLHWPGVALVELLFLLLAIAMTTVAFWRRSPTAGVLMLPYLGWVAFASVLNFQVWHMN